MYKELGALPSEIINFKSSKNMVDTNKELVWDVENAKAETLLQNGAQNYFKKEFPDLNQAFVKEIDTVVCIDEGCAHKDISGHGKLSIAGGGILLPARSADERIEIAARLFKEMGIKNVTSHEGCGAAKLAYGRDNPDSNPTKEQVNEYAKIWAEKVAQKMGAGVMADHIPLAEMERPAQFHNARVLYFDAVGGFNPNKEKGLPMGFVISRRHVPGDYALEELKVAVGIAFGGHGFGEFFNDKNQFVIIPLTSDAASLQAAEEEIKNALAGNENFSKIKIDGVVI